MKQHSTWRRVVVPAAFLAATVFGAAGPALADAGHGQGSTGQGKAHASPGTTADTSGDTTSGSTGSPSAGHATKSPPKTGDGATTFDKPNSWQAQADPDGMTNGGVDQPGGTGGTVGYQDGNNGSGNDIDCEDDNRGVGVPGHCKAKPHAQPANEQAQPADEAAQPVSTSSLPGHQEQAQGLPSSIEQAQPATASAVQILGISVVRPRNQPVRAEVAGISAAAQPSAQPAALMPSGQTLPNTGASDLTVPFAGAGALLLAGGAGLMRRRRSGRAAS